MAQYIFMEKNGIHIIDLNKTIVKLDEACAAAKQLAKSGRKILFVATKKQAKDTVSELVKAVGMPYVTERWPGGMLTNFSTIKKSINRLKEIERMREDGTFAQLTKKEVARLEKELTKLNKNFAGIVPMERMPKAMFVVDSSKEDTAVKEARRLSIPIVALIDTNSNPDFIDYPIPGNDDATKSIKVVANILTDAIIEGRKKFLSYLSQDGVKIKEEAPVEEPALLPEEEIKIKEIEEIVETIEPLDEDGKSVKKAHMKPTTDGRPKIKRKA
jgi:small subunit ribosomal protein S2